MSDHKNFQRPLDELEDPLAIPRWTRAPGRVPHDCTIRTPGSKSLTNRAILLAAMAPGTSEISHPLIDADDAQRMIGAVEALGAKTRLDNSILRIDGVSGVWSSDAIGSTIDLHHSGTATRFLAAAAALARGALTITGSERIQQRPIDELAVLLRGMGCEIEYHMNEGSPPVTITPPEGGIGSHQCIEIGKTRSSQYISALLLIGTCLPGGITIRLTGEITSASYIRMTIDQLDSIGVRVQASADLSVIRVHPGLEPFRIDIEPDASTASYWWGAGALLPDATIRVEGIGVPGTDSRLRASLQGDAGLPVLFERMGCDLVTRSETLACRGPRRLVAIDAEMSSMPDTVMTLGSVACFAEGTTIIRGVRTLRDKECDRVQAMVNEFAKIGVRVDSDLDGNPDALSITPPHEGVETGPDVEPVVFETYDDHRMAMALSLIALRRPNCSIVDPRCVIKSDGGYWKSFATLWD